VTVERRDHRLLQPVDAHEQLRQRRRILPVLIRRALEQPFELSQIQPGAEAAARAGNDHRPHASLRFGAVQLGEQGVP
jgi:hypothetical protein